MKNYNDFALHWEKVSMELADQVQMFTSANITIARFDIAEPEHTEIVKKYNIDMNNPTFKIFHNGSFSAEINTGLSHTDMRQVREKQMYSNFFIISI